MSPFEIEWVSCPVCLCRLVAVLKVGSRVKAEGFDPRLLMRDVEMSDTL